MPALTLYPYQKRWLEDGSRFKIGMMARQIGKSFTNTLEIVDDALAAESRGQRSRWVILSRGERQAHEAMEEGVKRHLQAYRAGFEALEYKWDPEINASEVRLPAGSRITALPANPDTARGFSANVFLDEFAFHRDSRAIWKALFPVISAGFKLRVVSTPNGKGNKFYELMTSQKLASVWSRHTTDIYQAVADGLPRNVEELRAGIGDEDAWAQEYELKWLDEALAWISFDLMDAVESEKAGRPELYAGGPVFLGMDIGARQDRFALFALEAVGDVLWTREVVVRKGASFAEQDALLAGMFEKYKVARLAMDQTGMGEKPVEDAKRRHGAMRVDGVLFTSASKQALAIEAKEAFEDRKLRIPLGDSALRYDLHKLQRVVGPTGIPRFVAERDSEGHADRTWALFLAISAAAGGQVEIDFQSSGRREGMQDLAERPDRGFGTVGPRADAAGF